MQPNSVGEPETKAWTGGKYSNESEKQRMRMRAGFVWLLTTWANICFSRRSQVSMTVKSRELSVFYPDHRTPRIMVFPIQKPLCSETTEINQINCFSSFRSSGHSCDGVFILLAQCSYSMINKEQHLFHKEFIWFMLIYRSFINHRGHLISRKMRTE
jgi:hypothetical protein